MSNAAENTPASYGAVAKLLHCAIAQLFVNQYLTCHLGLVHKHQWVKRDRLPRRMWPGGG